MSVASLGAQAAPASAAAGVLRASLRWTSCQDSAISQAPALFWSRVKGATDTHHDIPMSFWTNRTYRDDIARIVCYESSFEYHAQNAGQYGWFQMNKPLIESEGVTFSQYWGGTRAERPGWYEATAGERYILRRYGNPAAAWQHESAYGWY